MSEAGFWSALARQNPCLPVLSGMHDKFGYRALRIIVQRICKSSKSVALSIKLHDNKMIKRQMYLPAGSFLAD